MKRNENLVPLSRDHHLGLLCSWKILQGIKKGISYERIRMYINYYWENNLSTHFEIEDQVLPELQNNFLQTQMDKEHLEIRKLISCINQSQDVNLLSDFAKALKNHIRFEERVVFPNYEDQLTQQQIKEIGRKLGEIHQKEEDNYHDEFWNIESIKYK